MRILFITRKYPPSMGGMEVYSSELYKALQKKPLHLSLHTPRKSILGKPSVLQIISFFFSASMCIFRKRKHVDLVFLGDVLLTPLAFFVAATCKKKVKIAVAAHGNDVYFAQRKSLKGYIYRLGVTRFSNRVNVLIANSSDTESCARELGFLNTKRILLGTIIPKPIISVRSTTILFSGRLNRCKGLSWFIESVLPKLNPAIRLLVAGPEWDQSEMESLNLTDRAEYLGPITREALDKLRSKVIATVMPNLPAGISGQNEGFGLAAVESAAVGTPVIASRLGGLSEAVIDGITGFLVEPMNSDAFADQINTVAGWSEEKRREFSDRSRNEVATRFTWDRVAEEYTLCFNEQLKEAKTHPGQTTVL